jgi:hypothetical protein
MEMNRTFKAAVAALILVGFAGSVAAGPSEEAAAAYDKGDYAIAMQLLRPSAEKGNASSLSDWGSISMCQQFCRRLSGQVC